jgi:hypothetical protein
MTVVFTLSEPQIIVAWLAMFWVGRLKEAVQSS